MRTFNAHSGKRISYKMPVLRTLLDVKCTFTMRLKIARFTHVAYFPVYILGLMW